MPERSSNATVLIEIEVILLTPLEISCFVYPYSFDPLLQFLLVHTLHHLATSIFLVYRMLMTTLPLLTAPQSLWILQKTSTLANLCTVQWLLILIMLLMVNSHTNFCLQISSHSVTSPWNLQTVEILLQLIPLIMTWDKYLLAWSWVIVMFIYINSQCPD